MKYLLIFALLLTSCDNSTVGIRTTRDQLRGADIEIIEYEGCEYIHVGDGDNSWGAHKGNCKNPIHQRTPCQ